MKKKGLVSLWAVGLLLTLSITMASAVAPTVDVTVTSGGVDDSILVSTSSGVPTGLSTCEIIATSYLKFDIPSGTTEGGLFLYVLNAAYSDAFDLVVYQVDDDSWDATTAPGAFPTPGAALYTAQIDPTTNPVPVNQTIELSSASMDSFVQSQATGVGDGTASFAIQVINCSEDIVAIDFVSTEGSSTLQLPGPDLTTPTAVEMTTVSAANESSVSPILLAGIVLVILSTGILAVNILRRKETTA